MAQVAIPEAVPSRHWVRYIVATILLLVIVLFLYSAATNPGFQWSTVAQYLFNHQILAGLQLTILLTVAAMALGIALGVLLAVMRMSGNPVASWMSLAYVWVFRGTPSLVQLIFFFNLAALYPRLGLPLVPGLSVSTNEVITPLVAGILALGLHDAAYMAEIVRSGLLSVAAGQRDAAHAIGMTHGKAFWRIILPQALRIIVPPMFNNIIGMLKYSSLVSVISLSDLLYSAERIYSANFRPIPLLIVASIWYLVGTTVIMIIQRFIERYLSRGYDARSAIAVQQIEERVHAAL